MRIVFAGTPEFAAISLRALVGARHDIRAVYTQPDRPAGRGRAPRPSAVKAAAQALGVAVHQPVSLKSESAAADLARLGVEVMVVVAYGLLLPRAILAIPTRGCVNVHASLLPQWRGAAPIERAIAAGDTQTGVTLMRMVEALDAGPIMAQRTCAIAANDTAAELSARLAALGAELLVETLAAWELGKVRFDPQDDRSASYAPKIDKSEAQIDWNEAAMTLARKIHAFNPRPVAVARLEGRELRLWRAECLTVAAGAPPGTLVSASPVGLDVATGDGLLRLTHVQEPGRNVVSARDFVNAHRAWLGTRLASAPPSR